MRLALQHAQDPKFKARHELVLGHRATELERDPTAGACDAHSMMAPNLNARLCDFHHVAGCL